MGLCLSFSANKFSKLAHCEGWGSLRGCAYLNLKARELGLEVELWFVPFCSNSMLIWCSWWCGQQHSWLISFLEWSSADVSIMLLWSADFSIKILWSADFSIMLLWSADASTITFPFETKDGATMSFNGDKLSFFCNDSTWRKGKILRWELY